MKELYRTYLAHIMIINGRAYFRFMAKRVTEENVEDPEELFSWAPEPTEAWVDTECDHEGCKNWSLVAQGADRLYDMLKLEYAEPMHMQGTFPLPAPEE